MSSFFTAAGEVTDDKEKSLSSFKIDFLTFTFSPDIYYVKKANKYN
jgi:hypothetical protein